MKKFVHLHVHTEFSLLDGIARIRKLVDTASQRGWPAVAITDHGNMYGALQFYGECLAKGIKPILGTEFYCDKDITVKNGKPKLNHLVVLAKNNAGYHNLLKLNAIAHRDGFYFKPRIDRATLEKHREGLMILSACLAGEIAQALLADNYEEAKRTAQWFQRVFGDDFYIELQNHGLPEQIRILDKLEQLGKELGIKRVATNDVHYIYKEDAEMQDILMCVQMGKTVDEPDRMKFETDQFYLKTYEEMAEALPGYEHALDATLEIAAKCDVVIKSKAHGDIFPEQKDENGFTVMVEKEKDGKIERKPLTAPIDPKYVLPAAESYIPSFQPETGEEPYAFLRRLTFEGIAKKYPQITDEIRQRAETELEIIHSQGFVDYFLIVCDFISAAEKAGIPVGPGRGSGAGSLVAYAIGITKVEPLQYDLIFERFIHKERVSLPDFDIDFDFDRRGEVIDYVRKKYTPECVAQIVTFGTMAAKNALKDVARAMKIPYTEVDKLTKAIPNGLPEGIQKPPVLRYYFGTTGKPENEKYVLPELRNIYQTDEQLRKVIDIAIKLEGVPRNASSHACGVLISPQAVDHYVPLSRNGDDIVTQYNMSELESLGLLKMDFLGLRTLTDIDKTIKLVKKNRGIDIDFYSMKYDDPKVYDMLSEGKTDAVFQLESGGFKKFMKKMKPDCLEDIIAGVSLYRPGPMDYIDDYVANKFNKDNIVYDHPCLIPILQNTYGVIVYQEQVMKIVQVMGGYNMGQADNIRRIMGKKKVDQIAAERKKFIYGYKDPKGTHDIPGAVRLGIDAKVAETVFDKMENFARYAFNKSHATAYAFLSYQTAYLKCYYEAEFLAAVLNNRIFNMDEVKRYTIFAKNQKIDILPPNINKSGAFFEVEGNALRFGLVALKGLGQGIIEGILNERSENGDFKDLNDFCRRLSDLSLNKRVLEGFILSGAFDCFKVHRSQMMAVYEMILDRIARDSKNKATGQFSLFDDRGNSEIAEADAVKFPNLKEFNKKTKLKQEKEVTGLYLSGHPLEDHLEEFSLFNLTSHMIQKEENEEEDSEENDAAKEYNGLKNGSEVQCGGVVTGIKKLTTKIGNKEMAIVTLEDLYGSMELMFLPNIYTRYLHVLQEDSLYKVKGKLSVRSGENPIVMVDALLPWDAENSPKRSAKRLCLKYDMSNKTFNDAVLDILKHYEGTDKVFVKCTAKNQAFELGIGVAVSPHLLTELYGVLPQANVVVQEETSAD